MRKIFLIVLITAIVFGTMAYILAIRPVLERFDVTEYMLPSAPLIENDVTGRIRSICHRNGIDWDEFLIRGNGQALFLKRGVPAAELRFVKHPVITMFFRLQEDRSALQAFLESVDLSRCGEGPQEIRDLWLSGERLSPDAAEIVFLCGYKNIRGFARLPEISGDRSREGQIQDTE